MSLSAQYVTSRSIGPFGYTTGRVNGHYQAVLPTSKSSMHLNLHKNVPARIRPKILLENSKGILSGLKLLDKQRPKMKRFVGIKFDTKGKEQQDLADRLSNFNPFRFPAESRGSLPPIDALNLSNFGLRSYSEEEVKRLVQRVTEKQKLSAAEVQAIVDRLAGTDSAGKEDKKGEQKKKKKFSGAEVKALVERLASYDPESRPAESKGKPARSPDLSPLLKLSRQASKSEITGIVDRLAAYDIKKWPPGSKPVIDDADDSKKKKKGVSESELEQIVSRLATYDKKKWPPESSGMKEEFYQGKPLKFKNK